MPQAGHFCVFTTRFFQTCFQTVCGKPARKFVKSTRAFVVLHLIRGSRTARMAFIVLLHLAVMSQVYGRSDSIRAKAQESAKADIANWDYRYKLVTPSLYWQKQFTAILDGQYDLELIDLGSDPGSDALEEAEAYNAVIASALTKRYGYDVIARAMENAKKAEAFYVSGKAEAAEDRKKGAFKIQLYGLPVDWAFTWADSLRKKYNIEIDFGGCVITAEEDSKVRGYNEVMTQAIIQKYGRNVIEEESQRFEPKKDEETPLRQKGRQDAQRDVADGKYKCFMSLGRPEWAPLAAEIVTSRYGIQVLDWDAMKAQSLEEYCSGYEDVANAAIAKKFGSKALNRANQQAQRKFKELAETSR